MKLLNLRKIILALLCWPSILAAQIAVAPPEHAAITEGNYAERFAYGYARIQAGGQEFYIDSTGHKAFDGISPDSKANLGEEKGVVKVLKNGKAGLLTVQGKWILPAIYDSLDVDFTDVWKVKKEDKKSYATINGLQLPFFEDVGYLDGNYFDVKQAGKWGIYNAGAKKLVIPASYDCFDYCGGCGSPSDYVYAEKGGKWGIITYSGEVLVPFLYDHTHTMMRSDEWVQSFSKNGLEVLIHIPTRQVYPQTDSVSWELLGNGLLVKRQGSKCGAYTASGKELLPMEYETIEAPNDNSYLGYNGLYAIVAKNGKKGLVKANGSVLFQPVYEDIQVYDDYFVLVKNGLASLLDSAKHVLVPAQYTDISHINESFYSSGSKGIHVFRLKNKAVYGLYFADTKKLVPPHFHDLDLVSSTYEGEDRFIAGTYQGVKALFDLQGNQLLPLKYDEWEFMDSVSIDRIKVKKAERWGLFDTKKQTEPIPPIYDRLDTLSGHPDVLLGTKGPYDAEIKHLYDRQGKSLLPDDYLSCETLNADTLLLKRTLNKGYTLFSLSERRQKELPDTLVSLTGSSRLLLIPLNEAQGRLYDVMRAAFLPEKYNLPALTFNHGLAKVDKNGKTGFIGESGKMIVPYEYDAATDFQPNGVAMVARLDSVAKGLDAVYRYGFIDRSGRKLVPLVNEINASELDQANFFLGNQLILRLPDKASGQVKFGLASLQGHMEVKPVYDQLEAFNGGTCLLATQNGKFGIIGTDGKTWIPCHYDDLLINRYDQGHEINFPLLGNQNGTWKYYDRSGQPIQVEGVPGSNFQIQ